MKKVLIIIIAAIAAIIIALSVFIKIYVTPERVKAFIVPAAEKAMNRKIDIGDISISIFKGISLNDFAIRESDAQSDFVKCREFVLKFKLLPLLARQVVIDEFRMVSPSVEIKRGEDGKFNFEDIGQKKAQPEEAEKPPESGGLPISLLVNKIAVEDARFSLADALKKLPALKSAADIHISIKSADGSNIYTEGNIDLRLDEMVLAGPPEKHIRDLTAGLKYALNLSLESKDIRIDRADLQIQDIPASIKGDVKNLKTSPEVSLSVTIPKVQTSRLQKLAALFTDLKGLTLSGNLAADVRLDGELKKTDTLKANGLVTLDKVGIKYNEIDAMLDGNIKFDEKLMNIDLKSTIDKNTAEIKGSVKNYFKDQDINLNVYSKQLFLDQIIPAGKPSDKSPAESRQAATEKSAKEAGPLSLRITASGEVKIDSAVYRDMKMSDFYMQYKFKDNKLQIPKLTAGAGKGTVNLNSLVDLSMPGYAYNLSGNVKSLHADEIVNTFFPKAKDTVYGLISFNLKMNGAGTLPDNLKKNLVADADFSVKDGKITDANITKELSQFLNMKELETINLTKADGTIKVRDRVARLDSIFSSDDLSMDPKGNIGLDETLDLAFDLKLSPRLTDKAMSSKIGRYIKSDEGWGMIPLKVNGTFAKPSYTVDIEKAGKRIIKKEAEKYIDKLFDKKDDKKQKELEPVKDLLKGIF